MTHDTRASMHTSHRAGSPGAEAPGNCEPPDIAAGKQSHAVEEGQAL